MLDLRAGGERRARARRLIAHWIELLAALETPAFTDFYSSQIHRAMLYDVAELSGKLGLENEVRQLLMREGRDYDLSRWLFERASRERARGRAEDLKMR